MPNVMSLSKVPPPAIPPEERVELLTLEEMAEKIPDYLEISDPVICDVILERFEEIATLEKGTDEEKADALKRRARMNTILAAMMRIQKTIDLQAKFSPREAPAIHAIEIYYDAALGIKRKFIHEILAAVRKKRIDSKTGADGRADAFVEVKKGESIDDQLSTIEEYIDNPPDTDPDTAGGNKNPLYISNDITRPDFRYIKNHVRKSPPGKLEYMLNAIDENRNDADTAATRKRIQEVRADLALIERTNPRVAAEWAMQEIGIESPGLGKPVRLLLFATVSALAIMSTILSLSKLYKGEKLRFSDMLSPAYIAAALHLAGVPLTGKSQDDLMLIGRTAMEIREGPLGEIATNIGNKNTAIKAAKELASLLQDESEGGAKERLMNLMKNNYRLGIKHDALAKTLNGEGKVLLDALKELTPKERYTFIVHLNNMKIHEERNLRAALAALDAPNLYTVV